jgi:hypothetical protein
MPRTPIIVTLDDHKQHLIIDGEVTGCGQIVPHGLEWESETTRRCTTCFPEGKVDDASVASEDELVEAQQEVATSPKRTKSGAKA